MRIVKVKLTQIEHALKEREGINKELMQKVATLSREKAEKEKEHVVEMDDVIFQLGTSDGIFVLQAKINLTEDFENVGSCNVTGWFEALAKLTNKPVGTNYNPALQPIER